MPKSKNNIATKHETQIYGQIKETLTTVKASPIRGALRHELSWLHDRKYLSLQPAYDFGKGFEESGFAKNQVVLLGFPNSGRSVSRIGGQMMNDGNNPPFGIILCSDKSEAVVRYTLAEDNAQIFASTYMLCLPTEQELKNELYLAIAENRTTKRTR